MQHIYQNYPILPKSCTCGQRLGCFQKEIEERINQKLSLGVDLSNARIEVFREMNFLRVCCRERLTNSPKLFINDSEGDSYVDITKYSNNSYSNNRQERLTNEPNWGWIPLTKGVVQFNEIKYCADLYERLHGRSLTFSGKHTNFPKFPSILPTKKQSMPLYRGKIVEYFNPSNL